eukprot:442761_1
MDTTNPCSDCVKANCSESQDIEDLGLYCYLNGPCYGNVYNGIFGEWIYGVCIGNDCCQWNPAEGGEYSTKDFSEMVDIISLSGFEQVSKGQMVKNIISGGDRKTGHKSGYNYIESEWDEESSTFSLDLENMDQEMWFASEFYDEYDEFMGYFYGEFLCSGDWSEYCCLYCSTDLIGGEYVAPLRCGNFKSQLNSDYLDWWNSN